MNILIILAVIAGIFFVLLIIHILQGGIGGWDGRSMENILGVAPEDAVPEDLEKLTKGDLKQLFHAAPAPGFESMKGEIRGKMLPLGILFIITKIFERRIYGPGPWIGKAFIQTEKGRGWGYNLFAPPWNSGIPDLLRTRKFDSYVGESRIDGKDSFFVDYSNYNSGMVHTLCDEVRKINNNLYIGQGYIGMFGGPVTASPFYLYGEQEPVQGVDSMKFLKDKRALVTGASNGFGVDFANLLAEQGANLVLVARRSGPMEKLAEELRRKYHVEVIVEPMDLSVADAPDRLFSKLQSDKCRIDILINNAGFGVFGDFDKVPYDRIDEMLRLNILSLTKMTRLFGEEMIKRRSGYILLIASLAAYQATPTYAAYSASKSYVLLFGEALNNEWRKHGVKVATLSPGITDTGFLTVAGQKPTLYQRIMIMRSRPVAEIGLNALFRGKPSVISGWMNRVTVFFNRFAPRSVQSAIAYFLMKN